MKHPRHMRNLRRPIRKRGSRLDRIMVTFREGVEIFGSVEATLEWLNEEQPALSFRKPIELIASDAGATAVEQLLIRIRYNVYS